jgi:hypothetical protein
MRVWRWFLISAVVLSACSSSTPDSATDRSTIDEAGGATASTVDVDSTGTSTDATAAGSVPDSSSSDQLREVDHRVLIDGAPTGDTWTTAIATNLNALTQLWAEMGLSVDVPDVDFVENVVVFFGPAESSSCRFGPLTAVAYDAEVRRIYPVLGFEDPIGDSEERMCTADDNPHAIVVAISRLDLPDNDFDIWVDLDDPPACCAAAVTPVKVGELTTFDPTDTSGPRYGLRPAVDRLGEEIGSAATGPPLTSPQPWPADTIYTDLRPQELVVEFTPPDPDCIAATANAVIGRAGAILVRLLVDVAPNDGACVDGATINQVLVPLDEPLGDRRIYTLLADELPDIGAFADDLADSVIGLDVDAATEAIRATGNRSESSTPTRSSRTSSRHE